MRLTGSQVSGRNAAVALLPVVAAVALLLAGLWMRWPTVHYDGPASQDAFNRYADLTFAYSDIASLYYRDGLWEQPRPYLDYPLEYPVLTGLMIWVLNSLTESMPAYFLLTTLAMAVCALWIAALVPRFPEGKLALFALSPALALYVNLNWDMLGVVLMVGTLLLFAYGRHNWSAVVLAAATWTKFFPILFLPILLAERFFREGWQAALRFAGLFALASALINGPLLIADPGAWWHFFAFNAERSGDLNLYTLLFPAGSFSPEEMNLVGMLLTGWALVVLLMLQRRSPEGAWLPACAALLAWFFFVGKVYSPQYSLWIVALLAVVGASATLAVAWSAMDLAYFVASFVTLGLGHMEGEAQGWFVEHALVPAAYVREVMLLIIAGWCIKQMSIPARDRRNSQRTSNST